MTDELKPELRPEAEVDDAREFATAAETARELIAEGRDEEALVLIEDWGLTDWAKKLIADREAKAKRATFLCRNYNLRMRQHSQRAWTCGGEGWCGTRSR